MKDIIIRQINNREINVLVFSRTVESPLLLLDKVKECLKDFKEKSLLVLFDQLLQVGNTENRYLLLKYSDGEFVYNSARNICSDNIDIQIKKIMSEYLKDNSEILNASILLSNEKQRILEGEIL